MGTKKKMMQTGFEGVKTGCIIDNNQEKELWLGLKIPEEQGKDIFLFSFIYIYTKKYSGFVGAAC